MPTIPSPPSQPNTNKRPTVSWWGAVICACLAVTVCVFSTMVLRLLQPLLDEHRANDAAINEHAAYLIEHPWFAVLIAAPTFLGAVLSVMFKMSLRRSFIAVAGLALIPLIIVLVCFLQMVMPLYTYQPLS